MVIRRLIFALFFFSFQFLPAAQAGRAILGKMQAFSHAAAKSSSIIPNLEHQDSRNKKLIGQPIVPQIIPTVTAPVPMEGQKTTPLHALFERHNRSQNQNYFAPLQPQPLIFARLVPATTPRALDLADLHELMNPTEEAVEENLPVQATAPLLLTSNLQTLLLNSAATAGSLALTLRRPITLPMIQRTLRTCLQRIAQQPTALMELPVELPTALAVIPRPLPQPTLEAPRQPSLADTVRRLWREFIGSQEATATTEAREVARELNAVTHPMNAQPQLALMPARPTQILQGVAAAHGTQHYLNSPTVSPVTEEQEEVNEDSTASEAPETPASPHPTEQSEESASENDEEESESSESDDETVRAAEESDDETVIGSSEESNDEEEENDNEEEDEAFQIVAQPEIHIEEQPEPVEEPIIELLEEPAIEPVEEPLEIVPAPADPVNPVEPQGPHILPAPEQPEAAPAEEPAPEEAAHEPRRWYFPGPIGMLFSNKQPKKDQKPAEPTQPFVEQPTAEEPVPAPQEDEIIENEPEENANPKKKIKIKVTMPNYLPSEKDKPSKSKFGRFVVENLTPWWEKYIGPIPKHPQSTTTPTTPLPTPATPQPTPVRPRTSSPSPATPQLPRSTTSVTPTTPAILTVPQTTPTPAQPQVPSPQPTPTPTTTQPTQPTIPSVTQKSVVPQQQPPVQKQQLAAATKKRSTSGPSSTYPVSWIPTPSEKNPIPTFKRPATTPVAQPEAPFFAENTVDKPTAPANSPTRSEKSKPYEQQLWKDICRGPVIIGGTNKTNNPTPSGSPSSVAPSSASQSEENPAYKHIMTRYGI